MGVTLARFIAFAGNEEKRVVDVERRVVDCLMQEFPLNETDAKKIFKPIYWNMCEGAGAPYDIVTHSMSENGLRGDITELYLKRRNPKINFEFQFNRIFNRNYEMMSNRVNYID